MRAKKPILRSGGCDRQAGPPARRARTRRDVRSLSSFLTDPAGRHVPCGRSRTCIRRESPTTRRSHHLLRQWPPREASIVRRRAGHDRRGIPESHRLVRRSSRTASTALEPGVSAGGGVREATSLNCPVPTRTNPARCSRSIRPAGSAVEAMGSSMATALPRSVDRRHALRSGTRSIRRAETFLRVADRHRLHRGHSSRRDMASHLRARRQLELLTSTARRSIVYALCRSA